MLRPSGVIFDMDGLMLDSERIARIAWQEASRRSGHEMSDELFASLIGRREEDSLLLLRAAFGPHFNFKKVKRDCNASYDDYIAQHGLPVKPGVRELLDDLSARKVPLGVATSTRNPQAADRLRQVGLFAYFSVLVTGDQISRGKPAPDIYLEAIRQLKIDVATSFALEDSPAGVRSAYAAGLNVIMVPDLVAPTPEIAALAHTVAPSLHDVRKLFSCSGGL